MIAVFDGTGHVRAEGSRLFSPNELKFLNVASLKFSPGHVEGLITEMGTSTSRPGTRLVASSVWVDTVAVDVGSVVLVVVNMLLDRVLLIVVPPSWRWVGLSWGRAGLSWTGEGTSWTGMVLSWKTVVSLMELSWVDLFTAVRDESSRRGATLESGVSIMGTFMELRSSLTEEELSSSDLLTEVREESSLNEDRLEVSLVGAGNSRAERGGSVGRAKGSWMEDIPKLMEELILVVTVDSSTREAGPCCEVLFLVVTVDWVKVPGPSRVDFLTLVTVELPWFRDIRLESPRKDAGLSRASKAEFTMELTSPRSSLLVT